MADDEEVNWRKYLATFHSERAGVTEAVLSRALAGDHSPYRWLARAVSATATVVVDLACGSGPMSRELAQPGRTVIGLDLSDGELALAAERGPGPWILGDALRLPFRDGSVDVVTSSMGLVVVTPLTQVLEEVARVLRPGGVLAGIAPALRPLGPRDVRVLTRLNGRLRTKPQFPGPVELTGFAKALTAQGMRAVEDARERYRFSVRTRADAELMMSALYLPNTRWSRVERAIEYLEDRLEKREVVEVAIPMRRIVAIEWGNRAGVQKVVVVTSYRKASRMATLNISADTFEDTITDNDIVLVDFWAEWCGPCKRFGPIYEKASEEYDGIVFAKLDTDANQELSGQLGIEGIPTLMAFREGVLVFNQAGALPGPALKQVVQAVKDLDMVEVHAQVAKLQAEHGAH